MCGSRRVLTLVGAAMLLLAGCSQRSEQQAVSESAQAPPPAANAHEQPAAAPAQLPADSGLAIKRGILMLARDRMTFRPCDEKVELWLLDQSEGMLSQTFAEEMQKSPALLYVEAYGERGPVMEEVTEARAYAGTLSLEEILYAAPQQGSAGCQAPAASYIVMARGNEPSWSVEVSDDGMLWRQSSEPKEIALGMPQTQDAEGAVHYRASGGGHESELMVDAQPCRDSTTGEFFAYSARAVLDGKQLSGCARVGR